VIASASITSTVFEKETRCLGLVIGVFASEGMLEVSVRCSMLEVVMLEDGSEGIEIRSWSKTERCRLNECGWCYAEERREMRLVECFWMFCPSLLNVSNTKCTLVNTLVELANNRTYS
jgi:hypothetical protein